MNMLTKEQILKALEEIKDPEIPSVSIVDLGIVTCIDIAENNSVRISFTPTFVGCPAVEIIGNLIKEKISELDVSCVEVESNFDVQWNSNMITNRGRELLKKHGIAPPLNLKSQISILNFVNVECPYCGSSDTLFKSLFGSALCRAIHYCNQCLQSFEQFKPVT